LIDDFDPSSWCLVSFQPSKWDDSQRLGDCWNQAELLRAELLELKRNFQVDPKGAMCYWKSCFLHSLGGSQVEHLQKNPADFRIQFWDPPFARCVFLLRPYPAQRRVLKHFFVAILLPHWIFTDSFPLVHQMVSVRQFPST